MGARQGSTTHVARMGAVGWATTWGHLPLTLPGDTPAAAWALVMRQDDGLCLTEGLENKPASSR